MAAEDYHHITNLCKLRAARLFLQMRERQMRKFQRMMGKKNPCEDNSKSRRWVMNLSSSSLSNPKQEVLRKDLNLAPTPTVIPTAEIIAAVESATSKLGEDDATDPHNEVGEALRRANIPKSNLPSQLRRGLKRLKRNKDVVSLPADKGNTSVVMDQTMYDEKMRTIIAMATYQKLNKDPNKT